MTSYFSDGIHLYEVAAHRTVRNYGLRGGTSSYTTLRDCLSEAEARVDELQLMALTEIRQAP
jgi:hypothetical protein